MKKNYLLPISIIVLLLLNAMLVYFLNTVKEKRAASAKQLSVLQSEMLELNKLSKNYGEINENYQKLSSSLPKDYGEFAAVAQEFSTIASASGLRMVFGAENDVKIDVRPGGSVRHVGVTVDLVGSYPNLIDFLTKLSSMLSYIRIEQLSMEAKDEGIQSTMKLVIFMR